MALSLCIRIGACLACLLLAVVPSRAEDSSSRKLFLKRFCVECHADGAQEGDFNIEPLFAQHDAVAGSKHLILYERVFHQLSKGKMPPEKAEQPSAVERKRIVDGLGKVLSKHVDSAGSRDARPFRRRLNRYEYQNTLCDVLGLSREVFGFRPFYDTLPEDTATDGFDTVGDGLAVSELHLELFLRLAERHLNLAMDWGRPTRHWRWDYAEPGTETERALKSKQKSGDRLRSEGEEPSGIVFFDLHGGLDNGAFDQDFRAERMRPDRSLLNSKKRLGFPIFDDGVAVTFDEFQVGEFYVTQPGLYTYRIRCSAAVDEVGLENPVSMQVYVQADKNNGELARTVQLPSNQWKTHELTLFRELKEVRVGDNSSLNVRLRFHTEHRYRGPRPGQQKGEPPPDLPTLRDFYHHLVEIDYIEVEGPLPTVQEERLRISGILPLDQDELTVVRQVLTRFLPRAFRKEVADEKIEHYVERFHAERARNAPFGEALQATLMAALISPDFLFVDNSPAAARPGEILSPHALASRLSYFLWSSCPDEELLQLATSGDLNKPDELRRQVRRMMQNRKSRAFAENFASQWLHLREIDAMDPDPDLYKYDKRLEDAMRGETLTFFNEVLRNDFSILNFIDSDWSMLNERIADHYGIDDVRGEHFRRVKFEPEHHRGGVLGHASILKITSNSTRTSPVARGVFILENILGDPPSPPPDNAGELANKVPGLDEVTLRRQLEIHRDVASCARCHNKIDPIGFALEHYNAIGAWREHEADGLKKRRPSAKIDATATLPDGREINGPDELRLALMEQPDAFTNCFVEKLMVYALGRSLRFQDHAEIARLCEVLKENDYRMGLLIEELITSNAFRRY